MSEVVWVVAGQDEGGELQCDARARRSGYGECLREPQSKMRAYLSVIR